jgi:hypothetical protein
MTAAAIENSESVVMVSLMNLLLGAFTGTLPTPRFVDNDNHQVRDSARYRRESLKLTIADQERTATHILTSQEQRHVQIFLEEKVQASAQ